jgi:hypothetical protein
MNLDYFLIKKVGKIGELITEARDHLSRASIGPGERNRSACVYPLVSDTNDEISRQLTQINLALEDLMRYLSARTDDPIWRKVFERKESERQAFEKEMERRRKAAPDA